MTILLEPTTETKPAKREMPAEVHQALERLTKRSGDTMPLIVYRESYFPGDAKEAGWTATANLGSKCFAGAQAPTPDAAVEAWLTEARTRRDAVAKEAEILDRFDGRDINDPQDR